MTVNSKPSKAGGPGRGQGRTPADGVKNKKPRTILFSEESWAVAQFLGDGNASLGVSRALMAAAAKLPETAFQPTAGKTKAV